MTTGSAFGLHISSTHGTRCIRATGRLVVGAGAESPVWAMTGTLGDVDQVVMDLSDVTAIDARGVGRLLGLRQSLGRRGTRLTIATASARVRQVLQLTALDAIFGIASGGARGAHAADTPSSPACLCRCA